MKLEVEVISNQTIKPSSPTPDHLRHYKLSFLDQVTADVYNPIVYFYSPDDGGVRFNVTDILNQLKISLSEVLARFYPLAGRVNYNELFIDCNDDGIPFLETRVKCQLSDVVQNSSPIDLNKLVPFELDELTDISMGIQFNVFECGGIAIGVCISHKIGDALSFFTVTNGWAATCRGESDAIRPHFTSSKLFPPKNIPLYNTRNSIVKDRVVKRFVIDGLKVEKLRTKYAESEVMENQRRPSRVEALSAFIYSRFLKAIKDDESASSDQGENKFYLVCHTVNIRSKVDPPLPDYAFGNYYRNSMTVPSPETLKADFCDGLVKQVREEVGKINKEYLKQFQEDNKQLDTIKDRSARFLRGEIVSCAFTSLCRFPLYEADFGWGKPVWVGSPALIFKNLIVFFDTKSGDGIEVYIHLKEERMAKLDADQEFLNYASPTGC